MSSRTCVLPVAVVVCVVGCGPSEVVVGVEGQTQTEQEATKPLELDVPRRTYGEPGQSRLYTLTVSRDAPALVVSLTLSTGAVVLSASRPQGSACTAQVSSTHVCRLEGGARGTWTIEVKGATDFSGSLVTTLGTASDGGAGTGGTGGAQISPHTALGLADDARIGDRSRWLIVKPQYAVSYNATTKTPNWVSWVLDGAWLGSTSRSSTFKSDPDLPSSVSQAANADYDGSGFVRGHILPSSDRTRNETDNRSTFLFTNVVPQDATVNNGSWKGLENEERQLAKDGRRLHIIAGPIHGSRTVGAGRVNVPAATWKVVVVMDPAASTAADVTASTRVIAVIMDNTSSTRGEWGRFRVTVDEIERRTGLDLLADVPRPIQDVLEARVDTEKARWLVGDPVP